MRSEQVFQALDDPCDVTLIHAFDTPAEIQAIGLYCGSSGTNQGFDVCDIARPQYNVRVLAVGVDLRLFSLRTGARNASATTWTKLSGSDVAAHAPAVSLLGLGEYLVFVDPIDVLSVRHQGMAR